MSELITVSDTGYGEYSEKKSKFIGRVKHVSSAAEADEFIHTIRSRYWDARHNVYAYVIGKNGERDRKIMRRRMIDGILISQLADEFNLSIDGIKQIIYKRHKQMFKHYGR